ncbi:MBL fold metallo-hydrolase [Alkalihalobacillus sp. MEB130]|uniref:MBL fold metallo-hydrolase n=1 Tax=Alkalihalobacillus sp. MEB130 TaxID=2976704 RepID=UPI0028E096F1|nr:MBL fold metallo-hydrolase [Alkalihalobacillus sp. MEB130]MDT8861339.1 MBL fold metallo-hydrolase [Alkalihalobacillus sp. MEB130]
MNQLGIEKITFDLPFQLDHVHCFLAKGRDGWVIIDAGLESEKTIRKWVQNLNGKNVTNIVITHSHPDHFGCAAKLQELTDAQITMTEDEALLIDQLWGTERTKILTKYYEENGLPPNKVQELTNISPLITNIPKVETYLKEGEKIQFGNYEYETIFTPGHADGLFCLYNVEKKILFSTDHILPKVSPNICYKLFGKQDPLACFFQSLSKVKELEVDYVIPSHGNPFENVKDRIEELEHHHMDRLAMVLELIKVPRTASQVCEDMFPKHYHTKQVRFALGETLSHLEYLVNKGECKKELVNGHWVYSKNM